MVARDEGGLRVFWHVYFFSIRGICFLVTAVSSFVIFLLCGCSAWLARVLGHRA
jgi:hypothetical protein